MANVYRHIRLDKNEPFYIGIGKTEKRPYEKIKRNKFWQNIVAKTDYHVDILINDLTWEEACKKEIEFIGLYGRDDLNNGTLVNLTDGGEGGLKRIHSAETREKMSNSRKGVPKSKEWRGKISQSHMGMKINEVTRQKLVDSHKGRKHTEEQKLKISLSLKNRYFSPEHRLKISQALKGRKKSGTN